MITNETFNIQILPSLDTQEAMKAYDTDFLAYYWYPLSFVERDLVLQVEFKYPLNVSSSGPVRDRIKLTML
jgi:hypothetical protein